mmetsp:Transcript_17916/g.37185  ORF Transcript_17916/g.37185 Transcript_17916/m.37185 type:complete len:81 (-) Transcript_17916:467-709(-)
MTDGETTSSRKNEEAVSRLVSMVEELTTNSGLVECETYPLSYQALPFASRSAQHQPSVKRDGLGMFLHVGSEEPERRSTV